MSKFATYTIHSHVSAIRVSVRLLAHRAVIWGKHPHRLRYNRRTPIPIARSRIVQRSFVAFNPVQPNTALQPTPLAGRSRSGRFYGKACAIYPVLRLQGRG